jgi:hypothetical protein
MEDPMVTVSRRLIAWLALTLVVVAMQSSPSASHSWNGYHWARTSNPFTVQLGDNVGSSWDFFLNQSSLDWSVPPANSPYPDVLNAPVVAGQANPKNCRPTAGRVEVCSSKYGFNGWLGVAQIWVSGGTHITQGTVKLNDSYFNTTTYADPAWRALVACQEIGHTFGLGHQDENFDNPNLGTCMDYTNDPSTNQHPNLHDYEELATIYSHLDATTTLNSSRAASGAVLASPSEWGQLMKSSRGGRLQVFERDFGHGERIVTFVIWA